MSRFVPEFLEPLSGKRKKRRRFATLDIESKDGDQIDLPLDDPDRDPQRPGFTRPFLTAVYNPHARKGDPTYQEFRDEPHLSDRHWRTRHLHPGGCIDKLLSVILTKRFRNFVFYAHNGGSFDYLFFLAWLRAHDDEFGFTVIPIQTTIQLLRVWERDPESPDVPGKNRWEFLDSMRLIPMGLDRACKSFGLPTKLQHDLAMHEDDPRWSDYLKQDCVALWELMTRFHDMIEELGGEVGITTPATAMRLFRRRFLGQDGSPPRIARHRHWRECELGAMCDGCAHAWIRRGYYGGRTEIFRFFATGVRYYDLNSSYAAAMREKMPTGRRVVEQGHLDWCRHPSQGGRYSGFAECTVSIPAHCPIPPLPHRHRETRKLVFPAGRFHGVWSVEELLLLSDPLVGGEIVHVGRVCWFELEDVFSAMIDTLWRFRDKAQPDYDPGLDALAKLLINAGYGKFAMRPERTSIVFRRSVDANHCFLCGEEKPIERDHCAACDGSKPAQSDIDADVWYQAQFTDAAYIIPHIAAHITALARVRLWRYMKQAILTPAGERKAGELDVGDVVLLEGDTFGIVSEAS